MTISTYLKRKIIYLYTLLLGVDLFLISLPLTNSLGFEFAVINAIILYIIGGLSSAVYFRNNEIDILIYHKDRWKYLSPILIIPFIIGFFSSILASRCPIQDGLGFYFVITIPAFIFGNLTGAISSILSRKISAMIFIIFFLLIALIVLFEFYFNPQVYFYNPIFGFFPGTIYDEDVAVNGKLILSQFYNFIFFIGVYFSLKNLKQRDTHKLLSFVFVLFSIVVFVLLKPLFGFSTNSWKMDRELNKEIITQHFIIHFSEDVELSEQNFISLLHEYYYDQIATKLEIRIDEKITSYIYRNPDQKRELFGAGNANVSKPWLNQIYLNHESYQQALKHEIAHIAAAKFGYSIFKVADGFNAAMIEGLAMFAENDFDGYNINYAAKLAFTNGYKVNIENLFNGLNFFTSYSSIAYIYSGAFLNYLFDEYGINKIKEIYKETDWVKVYGSNLHVLASDFEKKLNEQKHGLSPNKAKLYFGGQTIFKKFCPRMASNELKEANNLFNAKKYDLAEHLYKKIFAYSNSFSALTGTVASLNKQEKYAISLNLLRKEYVKFRNNQAVYNLEVLTADTYAFMNDTMNAMKKYDLILVQSPHINYDNEVKIRKLILRSYGPDSLRIFYDAKREKKLNFLLKLNNNELSNFTLPLLTRIATSIKYDLTNWLENQKNKSTVSNYESFIASISISKYYLQRSDYAKAKTYAISTVKFLTSPDESYKAIENLRMVNWFSNIAEETKKNFHHTK